MILNQKNKIVLFLILLTIVSCASSKEEKKNRIEYGKYLATRNIDPIKVNDLDHYKEFFEYKEEQTKKSLINSKILKVDKVYMYNRSEDSFTFTVLSSDGRVHIGTVHLGEYLELNGSSVKFKKPVALRFIGSFELINDTIKVLRFEKTPSREWSENDVGYIKNDTIVYSETYIAKNFEYKKMWLAKTHKTNFRFGYQPNLVATFYKDAYNGYYEIEGTFNIK